MKILKNITVIATLLTIFTQTTLASTSITPSQLIPKDTNTIIESTVTSDTTEELIKAISNTYFIEDKQDDIKNSKLYQDIIKNKITVISTKNQDTVTMYKSPELYDELTDDSQNTYTQYKSYKIYNLSNDVFLTKINDLIVQSKNKQNIEDIITNYETNKTNTISNDTSYKNAQKHILKNSFLNIFLKITPEETNNLLTPLKDLAVSIEAENNNINFSILTNYKKALTNYNLTPSIYKNINHKNLIFYSEQAEGGKWIQELPESINTISVLNTYITLDVEDDILPLITDNIAIAIHKAEDTNPVPTVTILADISKNKTKAELLLKELNKQIQSSLEETTVDYSHKIETKNNETFYIHTYTENYSSTPTTIKFGITQKGLLVISSTNDLTTVLNDKGLEENNNFKTMLNKYSNTTNLSNITFTNLETLLPIFTEENSNQWHYIYLNTYIKDKQLWLNGTINLNLGKSTIEQIANLLKSTEPIPTNTTKQFCDVAPTDWFYNNVNNLTSLGIINGYEDGCFKPNAQITRAEFITIVIKATKHSSYPLTKEASVKAKYFKDITENDWFTQYINTAAANDLIKGYTGKVFKPNQPITRAEAIQVINNLTKDENTPFLLGNPFTDVSQSDWFYASIGRAYNHSIVNGKTDTTFAPNDNITRAEAATVINNFLYFY